MRKFSKILTIIFAMVTAIAFIACSDGNSSDNNEEKIITEFDSNYTIFSGNNDFGDWGGDEEPEPWFYFYCKGFSEGDQIQITHTKSETFSDYKMLEIWDMNWKKAMLEGRIINGEKDAEEKKILSPRHIIRPLHIR